MDYQHNSLASGRWEKMPFLEQMANIGSEVERAISWRVKKNDVYSQKAFERALELIDLTLDSVKGFTRKKELARVREAIVDYFAGSNTFKSTKEAWHKYFLEFTYAVRAH